jgi:hypothetical protein
MIEEISDEAGWKRALARLGGASDFYHSHAYHQLCAEREGGKALLVMSRVNEATLLVPLIKRRIPRFPDCHDGTTVYGHGGPLATPDVEGEQVAELMRFLGGAGLVSLFVRAHPFLTRPDLLTRMGRVRQLGQTVYIDTGLSEEAQLAWYRGSLRYDLQKLQADGYQCFFDAELTHLPRFAALYRETMKRLGAPAHSYFDDTYFSRLVRTAEYDLRLCVCTDGTDIVSGGLFSFCGPIAQYHLSGTSSSHVRRSPSKLVIDCARRQATALGVTRFHLGGGVGGNADSLFQFKSGFSPLRSNMTVLECILNPPEYTRLVELRAQELGVGGLRVDARYFPAYRAPGVASASASAPTG